MQSTSCEMLGWVNHKVESRRNINNLKTLRYADDTTLMAESERGTKKPLDEGERRECKSWLKVNIQKMKIMASSIIISWKLDGDRVETVSEFIFGSFKISVDGDWRPSNQKTLAPWKKRYDPPRQHIKKQRHHFANKGLSGQS